MRVADATFFVAGIGEHEAAGAVGRLEHAGPEARLPVSRRLLIAGDAPDRDRRAEMLTLRLAEIALAVAHLRQHGARHAEPLEQSLVPLPGPDVVELGAGGIGRVGGVQPAAGQPEQQEAVDGAEAHLARFGADVEIGDVPRAAMRAWSPRNKDRSRARSPRRHARPTPLAQARRRARRCGDLARRWRWRAACRSPAPTPQSSRADW